MIELIKFVKESNRIENIVRDPTHIEIEAHKSFLETSVMTVEILEKFVDQIAPGIKLRDKRGMDVRIGTHYPPSGGPEIREQLTALLKAMPEPYVLHHYYERLHPFLDGNGRSGRALWLWQWHGICPLGFLRTFYYQSLDHGIIGYQNEGTIT